MTASEGSKLLEGRTALVTGASYGLGAAFASALAASGATVAVTARSDAKLTAVVEEITSDGGSAISLPADVGQRGTMDRLVDEVVDRFGVLDILVNNAGISRPAMLWKMTDEQWDEVLAVNLTAVFEGVRAAARVMMPREYGRIVNVTSAAGIDGSPGQVNYGAAKAGVIGLTKSAARQLARYGITVNAVAPVAATPMTEVILQDEKLLAKTMTRIPLGRYAEPEEIAPSVVFLASDAASYTTGHVLLADGGMSM